MHGYHIPFTRSSHVKLCHNGPVLVTHFSNVSPSSQISIHWINYKGNSRSSVISILAREVTLGIFEFCTVCWSLLCIHCNPNITFNMFEQVAQIALSQTVTNDRYWLCVCECILIFVLCQHSQTYFKCLHHGWWQHNTGKYYRKTQFLIKFWIIVTKS